MEINKTNWKPKTGRSVSASPGFTLTSLKQALSIRMQGRVLLSGHRPSFKGVLLDQDFWV